MPWRAASTGSNLFWMLLCSVLAVGAFLVDLNTRLGVAMGLLYVLAVFPSVMFTNRRWAMATAMVSAVLVLIGWYVSPSGADGRVIAINRLLSLAAIAAAAWTVTHRLRTQGRGAQAVAVESLRESEAQLRDVTSTLPGIVYRTVMTPGGDHRVEYVTSGLAGTLGWRPEQIMAEGFDPLTLIHPSQIETARHEMLRAAREGAVWRRELPTVTPEGETRVLWVCALPRPLPDGNTLWSGIALDVTERHWAEQARRESEERFGAVFENAAAGMALIGPDGRFQRVNPALCEMFGYSAEELLRLSVEGVTHPDDRELSRAALRRLIDGETEVARFQKRYRAKDGSTVWTRAMVAALRGGPGQLQLVAVVADVSEQARVEQALRESEAVRRSIMECSPDYIAMLDREGTYLFLNRTARGYQLSDVIGHSIYSLVSAETAEIIRNTLERVAKTGRPDRFQVEHQLPEGGRVWYESDVGPVVKDGEVTAYIVSTRDITSRMATERAFQESEDRYRSLVELSPDAIFLNKNDRISYVNSAGLRLFGASSASQLIGKSAFDLIHPDCHPQLHERIERLQKGDGKAPLIEEKIVRVDGTVVDVEVAASLIANNRGTVIQVVVRDISERKRAAEALARSEQHFRSLIENSLDVFSVVNRDGTSRYHSPSLRRVLGYGPEELSGSDPFELVHPDDAAAARARFCEGLRASGTHQPVEVRMRHRDGSWRWVEIIANNQLDNTAVAGITLTARDVTERKRAQQEKEQLEAQLWQAQKLEALGVLAGGIAHDFNNLLTSVTGFTTLAAEEAPAGSSARANLEEAIRACDRARELVQQMLTFGRRETRRKQPLDIADSIGEAVRMVRATMPGSIEIRQRVGSNCGKVLADPGQLQQVLMNLCTNAYQAIAPAAGILDVELIPVEVNAALAATLPGLHPGRYVKLSVTDSGPGIDPLIRDRIFEPFFTTKVVGEGSGLGLSVVHGIVTTHGGAIGVESVPGRGACFSLYFPQHDGTEPQRKPGSEPTRQVAGRVLFVDDEESVVRLGRTILERLGYQVTALRHGVQSLQAFRAQPGGFDVVISDISMPEMSGLELTAEIRKLRSDIPVILTTGFHTQISPESAKMLGVREVLFKPFTAKQLGEAIHGALAEIGIRRDRQHSVAGGL